MIAGLPDPLFLMGRGGGGGAVKPSSLLTNLVSYWKLDEASGTAADSAGTNTLTANNSPVGVPGKIGNGRQFVLASSQRLTVADNPTLNLNAQDATFSGWVRFNSVGVRQAIIGQGATIGSVPLSDFMFFLYEADNHLYVDLSDGVHAIAEVGSPAACVTATWYFFVWWYDSVAKTVNLQIGNGAVQTIAAPNGVRANVNAYSFALGGVSGGGGNFVNGILDEVGFWKSAPGGGGVLTSAQRTALYNAGAGVTYPFAGVP